MPEDDPQPNDSASPSDPELATDATDAIHLDTDRTALIEPSTIGARERFGAYYTFYVGLFALVFAYLITVRVAEALLQVDFQERADRAIVVKSFERPVSEQIKQRIDAAVHASRWVRWGGLQVTTLVLAQDEKTWLYVDGHTTGGPKGAIAPVEILGEWMEYLPATARVTATLPHNALFSNTVLILYSSSLLVVVYWANRRVSQRESARLGAALTSRNIAARRTAEIEAELEATRSRLSDIEPHERERSEEIEALQEERHGLEAKLGELAQREEGLRGRADQAVELAHEVHALEDLLEEASGSLDSKDEEIDRLEQDLARVARRTGKARTRDAERIARRFRTLYKTIEIDDRAIDDLATLGDDSLRLRAEEAVKRLADEADNVAVRRKVGGLPDSIHVFELGFAGKGRVYYSRGRRRRFRILLVGAKNTQTTDLDYLRRLPPEEFK